MSNCYSLVTAQNSIKCSKEDHAALAAVFEPDGYDDDGYELESSGLALSFDAGANTLYIYGNEGSANIDALPKEALAVLGKIIEKAGLPFWEFGVAFYDDKPRPGTCGGEAFRILPDGSLKFATLKWD